MEYRRLPYWEFSLLISVMFGLLAFGTDAMLPAFPEIAKDLKLVNVNKAQFILSSFVVGTAVGQLITGPMSDSFGRKPVITAGLLVFVLACIMAYFVKSLEWMLVARFIQGLGISAPRTVTMALIRDLYSGRKMARVVSIAMAVFVLVPAVAPAMGQYLFLNFGWRSIYLSFILVGFFSLLWLNIRQPETLEYKDRKSFRVVNLLSAFKIVSTNQLVVTYTAALSLAFGALFGYLNSAQQIFVTTFNVGAKFPMYFAIVSILAGSASFLNAALVMRFGMRLLATIGFGTQAVMALLMVLILYFEILSSEWSLIAFIIWSVIAFFIKGMYFGNLNALAMEPMGKIAGMASAIIGAVATLLGILIAVPIGLLFNGTPLPVLMGYIICSGIALIFMLSNPKEI
jgi:DHA1 family bicyclomycin/chloramphenicol resistance-like MFS transporter